MLCALGSTEVEVILRYCSIIKPSLMLESVFLLFDLAILKAFQRQRKLGLTILVYFIQDSYLSQKFVTSTCGFSLHYYLHYCLLNEKELSTKLIQNFLLHPLLHRGVPLSHESYFKNFPGLFGRE